VSRAASFAVVLAVCLGTTFALTPLVRMLALRFGAVQEPDERRVHEKTTAVIGGVAMFGGFLAGFVTASRLDAFNEVFSGSNEPKGVLLAAFIIVVIGHVDDLKDVSAPAKLAGTVLAASALVLFGVSMIELRVPFYNSVQLSPDLTFLLSVLWVVAMAHAINLIDGLDGLAAGIVGIAATVFFLYTVRLSDQGLLDAGNIGPLIALLVVGMCVGFLPWNAHPAKIFMGDGGALLLGVLMAASTMVVGGRPRQDFNGQVFFFYAPLVIPILVLGVPIFDTGFAIIRRAVKRSGVATADKEHLHHRLMRLGHGHRRTVFILWAWTALLSGFVLYPVYTGKGDASVPLGLVGLALLLYSVLHPSWRKGREVEVEVEVGAEVSAANGDAAVGGVGTASGIETTSAPPLLTAAGIDAAPVDGREIRKKAARQRAERRATGQMPAVDPRGKPRPNRPRRPR